MIPSLMNLLATRTDAMVSAIEQLVSHESPSRDKAALDALADTITGRFERIGASVERLDNPIGGDHLRIRSGSETADSRPALILGHFDTVWPIGTLRNMPFRVEEGCAYGPGVFDMKSSLVIVEFALSALKNLGIPIARPVELLLTSDEEIGSPTSRRLIEAAAQESAYVLVLEPPLSGNRFKTARKGVGGFILEITGKAAHAGVEPGKGVNAILELAHQILKIHALADSKAGTTLNVGVVQGGTTPNVVPASATASIDARASTLAEAKRIEEGLARLIPVLPGATLTISGGFNRPPMERTTGVASLYQRARVIGLSMGLDLGEGSTGGGSDGNFTAALGVPTLDGLGVPGEGAHASNEHILIPSLPERAALLAALLMEL